MHKRKRRHRAPKTDLASILQQSAGVLARWLIRQVLKWFTLP